MITEHDVRLALPREAVRIAEMSRDFIERGLGWRYRPGAIQSSIEDPSTNVVVAHESGDLVGFAVMAYRDDEARLQLLAVEPARRRQGVASTLLSWLEKSALTAGIGAIYLEVRAGNAGARAFYSDRGYTEVELVCGYYQGREDCVRVAKDLWLEG